MMRAAFQGLSILLPLFLTGCPGPDESACTDIAMASVVISVVQGDGRPLAGATVTFSLEGDDFEPAICTDGETPESCTAFVTGYETPGNYVVRAQKQGYLTAEESVTVHGLPDGCHVDTEEVRLVMARASL